MNVEDQRLKSNRRTIAAILTILGLAGMTAFLIWGTSTGFAYHQGFLGTSAPYFADFNLVCQSALLVGLSIGFVLARLKKISAHQYNQTAWVLLHVLLIIIFMDRRFRSLVVPGIATSFNTAFLILPTIHAVTGTLAAIFGLFLILRMNDLMPRFLRISWWKGLMRVTLVSYWITIGLGLATYFVWYGT